MSAGRWHWMAARSAVAGIAAIALGCSPAAPVAAAEGAPLSVIDWLSDSVAIDAVTPSPAPATPGASLPSAVSVAPLDAPLPDHAGLLEPGTLGLDPAIWGRSSAQDLAGAVSALPDSGAAPPSLRSFLRDLLIARFDPPLDAASDDAHFLARIDRLLAMGQLELAGALIAAAGPPESRRFRRAFDIALIAGTETEACGVIESTPDISPTYVARIFCLARLGQWDVAATTLGNATALAILTPEEESLLRHFLEPDLFESEPVPAAPRTPSPLVFRIYEAVGERLPTDQLPVAFARADLTDTVGWKTRLEAAERLTAAGAMSFGDMLAVFSEREPAASGGLWDRVEAIRNLVRDLDRNSGEGVAASLPAAWAAAREAGYGAAMAHWAADRLQPHALTGAGAHQAFEMALLAGRPDLARQWADGTPEDRFLLDLASGNGAAQPPDAFGRAVLRGLAALGPDARYRALIEDGRAGEALLRAMAQLMEGGAAGNPEATAQSLALLRELGLGALARQVAVELVLMEGAA